MGGKLFWSIPAFGSHSKSDFKEGMVKSVDFYNVRHCYLGRYF